MQKIHFLVLLLTLFASKASAQKINYEKSFEEAKAKSLKLNKPLAILVYVEPPANVTNFLEGLNNEDVVNRFNTDFINYRTEFKLNGSDSVSQKIVKQYKISRFPGFVFLDSKGGLMMNDYGNSSASQKYLTMADNAMAASKEKSLTDFDEQYKSGLYNLAFLQEYITKRKKIGITDNAEIIEKYINLLAISDLDDYNKVLFILQAGPLVDGKAYILTHINKNIIDSIFKTEPLKERIAINNAIITNTFNSAVANKNISRANAVSSFVRNTWRSNYLEGQKQGSLKMIQYYNAVKDTLNYLQQASNYYEQYYMNISVDSIKKLDDKRIADLNQPILEKYRLDLPPTEDGETRTVVTQIKAFTQGVPTSFYATDLNNAAFAMYQMGGRNTTYLAKALLWSKRSIELSPVPAYYDTLAHLLYALGFYVEAESIQQKAIQLAKESKRDLKDLQDELIKMKNKTL